MDVYDCIGVAERESEGKTMAAITRAKPQLTASQRMAIATRLRQLREGKVVIPRSCPSCYSPTVKPDSQDGELRCLTCGRATDAETMAVVRKQRIRRFLLDGKGVDVK